MLFTKCSEDGDEGASMVKWTTKCSGILKSIFFEQKPKSSSKILFGFLFMMTSVVVLNTQTYKIKLRFSIIRNTKSDAQKQMVERGLGGCTVYYV